MIKWPLLLVSATITSYVVWLWRARRSIPRECSDTSTAEKEDALESSSNRLLIESQSQDAEMISCVVSGNTEHSVSDPIMSENGSGPNTVGKITDIDCSEFHCAVQSIFLARCKLTEPYRTVRLAKGSRYFRVAESKLWLRNLKHVAVQIRRCELDCAARLLEHLIDKRAVLASIVDGHKALSLAFSIRGWIFAALDMLDDAQRMYWEAVQLWLAEASSRTDAVSHFLLLDLANVCSALDKQEQAEQLYIRAHRAASDAGLPIDQQALTLLCLADALCSSRQYERMHRVLAACQQFLRYASPPTAQPAGPPDARTATRVALCSAVDFEMAGLLWRRGDAAAGEQLDTGWISALHPLLERPGRARAGGLLPRLVRDLALLRQEQGALVHAVPLLERAVGLCGAGAEEEAAEALLALSEARRRSGLLEGALEVRP